MQLMPVELLGGGTSPPAGAVSDNYAASMEGIGDRVSWWRFGETAGTTAADEEDTEPGEYKGGVSLNRPPLPAATDNRDVRLDGVDGYVEIAHNAAYEQLAAGTILIWFRLDSLNTDQGIFSKDAAGLNDGDLSLWYRNSDDDLRFHIQDGAQQQAIASVGALVAGQTYCAVMQWGAGGMKLYLASGAVLRKLGENAFPGGIGANNRPIYVGAVGFAANPPVPSNFAAGTFGDVVIWNRALSEPEIETATQATLAGYEQTVTGLNPAIYLKLDEASGSAFADSSGGGRNGTLNGTASAYNVSALPSGTAGANGGVNLGNAAWISVAHATADTALTLPAAQPWTGGRKIADCTVSIWFKPNSLPTGADKHVIVAKSHTAAPDTSESYAESHPILASPGSTVNGGSWEAYLDANGAVHVEVRSFRGRPCRIRTPNGAVAAGTTYHLVVQLSYDGVAAWLDGAKFEDGYANLMHVFGLCANIRRVVFRNNYAWTIGRAAWGGQADLQVDEFAVYLTTLTQAHAETLAQVGPTAPLAHHVWGALTVNRSSYGSIQAAIDDVNSRGGGTVLINPGPYTENITMKSRVRLKANGGTVNITGWCRTAQLSPTALGVGTGNFATGAKTLTINNSASAGQLLKIMGVGGDPAVTRHERRWIDRPNGNDPNIPDGQAFEIASRTGTTITVAGVGSTYQLNQADRASVTVVTPTSWIALEGDLRFTSSNTIEFYRTMHARVVGITANNNAATSKQAISIKWDSMYCQVRNMTANQATLSGTGNSDNDGLQAYLGAIDVVYKDCVCKEGRHGADIASNLNFGPVTRCEFHNCEWDNTNSRTANGTKPAVGVHGQGSDTIYWNFTSNWGGPSITGWKHDARWMVCGDPAAAGSSEIGIGDGAGDCCMRDFHLIRPANWFWTYEATVNVKRCHFENITRSQAPAGSSHRPRLVYATGADVNTFSNVDEPHGSWTEV